MLKKSIEEKNKHYKIFFYHLFHYLSMNYISFTIDIDRDVNIPLKNEVKAFSFPAEKKQIRFSSSQKGFLLLIDLLNKLNINATLFFEGKTTEVFSKELNLKSLTKSHEVGSHGYEHEDFLGTDSKIILSKKQKKEILQKSLKTLNEIFGKEIKGFRAPYCRIDYELIDILAELKFSYDSSMIKEYSVRQKVIPFIAKGSENEIIEFPIPTFKDQKKTSLYLWQLHEGKRTAEQYINLIKSVLKKNQILILATHPWHICENFARGILNKEEVIKNLKEVEKILIEVKKVKNVEFLKLSECLDIYFS